MKVTIRDSQILKTIEPEVLQAHLQAQGWHETGRIYNNTGAIWRFKQGTADESEILLPLTQSFGDYAARMSDAIKTLEEVENRSQIEILSELISNAPNMKIQGLVALVQSPDEGKLKGEITLFGVVFDKLQKIHTELADNDYILAFKAYQERLPVLCTGDLVKENNKLILKNTQNFQLDKSYSS